MEGPIKVQANQPLPPKPAPKPGTFDAELKTYMH